MKVLSLFDGISCARVALDRAGIPVEAYYASEIDKYAIQVSQKNWIQNTMHVGSVIGLKFKEWNAQPHCATSTGSLGVVIYDTHIDLLIGGSPCQDLSIAKKDRKGLDGERSGLFWEYVRILRELKPKYFILENVASMPKEAKAIITEAVGVEPIMINASLVSAQNRKRLFWTNIPNVTLPEDRGILLKDILEQDVDEKYNISQKLIDGFNNKKGTWNGRFKPIEDTSVKCPALTDRYFKMSSSDPYIKRIGQIGKGGQGDRIYSPDGKSVSLSALGGGRGAKTGLYLVVPEATKKGYAIAQNGDSVDLSFPTSKTRRGRVGNKVKNLMTSQNIGVFTDGVVRKLTPTECERLQGLPDNYTEGVSNSQRYKCLGNAFNVDVVAHILSFIKKK